MTIVRTIIAVAGCVLALSVHAAELAIDAAKEVVLRDAARDKDLQLRVTYPVSGGPYPVIVFSHGAWGTNADYEPLIAAWARSGYVCIQPNHADSAALGVQPRDISVFRDWAARPGDIMFILDSLGEIGARIPGLGERMAKDVIGVGGHSYGANTAQLIGGARAVSFFGGESSFRDPRASAVLLLSPQGRGQMFSERSWEEFRVPMMVITGTNDRGRMGDDYTWRTEPFKLSPPGEKFLLVIDDAYHDLGGVTGNNPLYDWPKRPDQIALVQAATLDFWNTYLKGDSKSKEDLMTRSVLRRSGAKAMLDTGG
jgi:predicted dienelactone hydrolase